MILATVLPFESEEPQIYAINMYINTGIDTGIFNENLITLMIVTEQFIFHEVIYWGTLPILSSMQYLSSLNLSQKKKQNFDLNLFSDISTIIAIFTG